MNILKCKKYHIIFLENLIQYLKTPHLCDPYLLGIFKINLLQYSGVIEFQIDNIFSKFFNLIFPIIFLMYPQKFSIGFYSGLWAAHSIVLISFFFKKFEISFAL